MDDVQTLADGTPVPVDLLGGVWVAEWVSKPQAAIVCRGDEEIAGYDRRVHY